MLPNDTSCAYVGATVGGDANAGAGADVGADAGRTAGASTDADGVADADETGAGSAKGASGGSTGAAGGDADGLAACVQAATDRKTTRKLRKLTRTASLQSRHASTRAPRTTRTHGIGTRRVDARRGAEDRACARRGWSKSFSRRETRGRVTAWQQWVISDTGCDHAVHWAEGLMPALPPSG
jgi:hypothetical protein